MDGGQGREGVHLGQVGLFNFPSSETEKFVAGDVERWGKIIRDANIKMD